MGRPSASGARHLFLLVLSLMASSEAFGLHAPPPAASTAMAAYTTTTADATPYHLAVVVHGYVGRPTDLAYLCEALVREGKGDVLAHAAVCNLDKTKDGVARGGTRLAEEVRQVIAAHPSLTSISFIGNSLGGLYSRYALSLLWEPATHTVAGLQPVTFMTVATPHLGVRRYTLVPIPDQLHVTAGLFMGQTGDDLFLRSKTPGELPLLTRMVQEPAFMRPLAAFQHRRAYGNSKEDLLVPLETALFHPIGELADLNTVAETLILPNNDATIELYRVPRSFLEDGDDDGGVPAFAGEANALLASGSRLTSVLGSSSSGGGGNGGDGDDHMWYESWMAARLDSVGWEKIAVNFRFPFLSAHNMICALTRGPLTRLFRKGRVVMDHAASYIVVNAAAAAKGAKPASPPKSL